MSAQAKQRTIDPTNEIDAILDLAAAGEADECAIVTQSLIRGVLDIMLTPALRQRAINAYKTGDMAEIGRIAIAASAPYLRAKAGQRMEETHGQIH